jgi:hypothetical protein
MPNFIIYSLGNRGLLTKGGFRKNGADKTGKGALGEKSE